MSVASPQNRDELKAYIKTKLGAPVLQINVSDEQMDVAINDAFQYFFERQHFDATERVYLSMKIEPAFQAWTRTAELQSVTQATTQPRSAEGMVDTLTLVTPGTGYAPSDELIGAETTGGNGSGLKVTLGGSRTTTGGLTAASVYVTGSNYQVGDQVTIVGGNNDAVFQVATIKTESPLYGNEVIATQNNYIVLPEGVIGVNRILRRDGSGNSVSGAIPGIGLFNPFLTGGYGDGVGNLHFDMTSYYTMQQYVATLNWNLYPPISYNFNKRTHRLFINSSEFNGASVGDFLVFECDIKANPDMFPDVWDDMFLKKLSVAYVQLAWGRILTKYQQVQLPGGLTMNGDQIYNDAKEEINVIQERFMLDYGNYALDIVG